MPTSSSPSLDAKIERMRRAAARRDGTATPPQVLPEPVAPRRGDDWPADDVRRTRPWVLTAYTKTPNDKGKRVETVLRTSTCVGDLALDEAIRTLEHDSMCTRYAVRPAR